MEVATAWSSEIGSLASLAAPEFHASSDVREPISLHQAVYDAIYPFVDTVRDLKSLCTNAAQFSMVDTEESRQKKKKGSRIGIDKKICLKIDQLSCETM